jgi:hypothetical protein
MYTLVKYINSVVITDRERVLNVLKFVVIIFISVSYFKSQNYMKIMSKNLIGIANLHISTIVLLNSNSDVFHFDDFNYGRRSQPYFF